MRFFVISQYVNDSDDYVTPYGHVYTESDIPKGEYYVEVRDQIGSVERRFGPFGKTSLTEHDRRMRPYVPAQARPHDKPVPEAPEFWIRRDMRIVVSYRTDSPERVPDAPTFEVEGYRRAPKAVPGGFTFKESFVLSPVETQETPTGSEEDSTADRTPRTATDSEGRPDARTVYREHFAEDEPPGPTKTELDRLVER